MSRKMNLDVEIARLRKLHNLHKANAERLTAEIAILQEKLNVATHMVSTTEDALDALEGRPSLKKQLEDALKQNAQNVLARPELEPLNSAVGTIPKSAAPASGPVAETLILPPVMDDEDFNDKPEDLL